MPADSPKNKKRSKDTVFLLGLIAVIIIVNILSNHLFYRLDLTSDKRYTLSDNSKRLLRDLDQDLYITVFLDGELDLEYEKFKQSIGDLLYEFQLYGGSRIKYEFVNPFEETETDEERSIVIEELKKLRLRPETAISRDKEGGMSGKIVFPGAMVRYGRYVKSVNFLTNDLSRMDIDNIDYSRNLLEYKLIKAIKTLKTRQITRIAFLQGHGELDTADVEKVTEELAEYYVADSVYLHGRLDALDNYKVCVIARPQQAFSTQDKYILDQYLMRGGRILWLIDPVLADPDELIQEGTTLTNILDLNLQDLFLGYGFRIERRVIKDLNCDIVEKNVSRQGEKPSYRPFPMTYFPLLIPNPDHPITKNLNDISGKISHPVSLTRAHPDVTATPLIYTSDRTQLTDPSPIFVMEEMLQPSPLSAYKHSYLVCGLLLEGRFRSISTINRSIANEFEDPIPEPIYESQPTKMVVIGDGDIIRNQVEYTLDGSKKIPGNIKTPNLNLIVNTIEYLADDTDLLELRNRRFEVRRLDAGKIKDAETFWKVLNMIVPSLLVIIMGGLFLHLRKKRYAK